MSARRTSRFEPGRMPGKHEVPTEEGVPAGAHHGQVFILFAIFAIAMIGVLGLATDVGYAMAARRAVQGAADAGAIAGARALVKYPSMTTAQSEVNTIVTSTTFGDLTPTLYRCEYINGSWGVVGTCNQAIPSSAVGTRVRTRLTFSTYFMRVVPGAPDTLTAAGYTKARVEAADTDAIADQAPFIICGEAAWDVSSNPTSTSTSTGTNVDFNSSSSGLTINSSHIGKTFRVMDPSLPNKGDAECSRSNFMGRANQASNNGKTAGSNFDYFASNTTPGSVVDRVKGAEGCAAGASPSSWAAGSGCVMMLPVADTTDPGTNKIRVRGFAAFKVTKVDANRYNAQLLNDYFLGSSTETTAWSRDTVGSVVIRIIW
jgi:hypothetical protein